MNQSQQIFKVLNFITEPKLQEEILAKGQLMQSNTGDFIVREGDEAHGTFIQIPIGEETVPHTHSHTYHGIVVKGVVENPVNGDANPKQLPAGSFWYQPGEQAHITRCADNSTEPCLVFIYQSENFDFIPQ